MKGLFCGQNKHAVQLGEALNQVLSTLQGFQFNSGIAVQLSMPQPLPHSLAVHFGDVLGTDPAISAPNLFLFSLFSLIPFEI